MSGSRTQRRRSGAIAVTATAAPLLLLTACSGGSTASGPLSSGSGQSRMGVVAAAPIPAPHASAARSKVERAAAPGPLLVAPKLIKTGSVSLASQHVGSTVSRVYALVAAVQGRVSSEQTYTDHQGRAVSSQLVVEIPVATFDTSLSRIATFGRLLNSTTSSQDVTAAVADVRSRVASAHRSIAALRQLFSRATKLGDVILIQDKLARNEARLEALQARQRALTQQTTMSTITVSVRRPPHVTPPPVKAGSPGFIDGLKQGWAALLDALTGLSHAAGAALPSLALLAVLFMLARAGVRQFRPTRASQPPTETPSS